MVLADDGWVSTTYLPENGWLPDPEWPGALRYRDRGRWTDQIITAQKPWGAATMLPPVLHRPLHLLACA